MAAPTVQPNEKMDDRRHLDPTTKELAYNPKFEELYAPLAGPVNPHKTQQESAVKNTLAGYVEPAHINNFQFELERRTFHSYGYAHDPSQDSGKMVTNTEGEEIDEENAKTVFEAVKARPKDKRKREKNDDPTDIEGFLGKLFSSFSVSFFSKSQQDGRFLNLFIFRTLGKISRRSYDFETF